MSALPGILGGAALFALFAYTATRRGTRLEARRGCQGDFESLHSCSPEDGCDTCGHADDDSAWWPEDRVKDGDRR